jgi:hypothetical protein
MVSQRFHGRIVGRDRFHSSYQIFVADLLHKARDCALPAYTPMIEQIDAVGMFERKMHILFSQQYGQSQFAVQG